MTSPDYERWAEIEDRLALGEAITEEERRFVERFAETDETARSERALFGALESLDGLEDEIGNRRVAELALDAALARKVPPKRRAWLRSVAGAGVAAAAAAAAFIAMRAPHEAGSFSTVELARGRVVVEGADVRVGARLPVGTEVEAIGGPACIAVEPTIHACLASGAKIRLSQVGGLQRRVDLMVGRVGVALAPLPAGEHFSVVAGGSWSTAVGTAYTVELRNDGTVETIVHEGKVAVGREDAPEIVQAHRIGLYASGKTTVEALGDHARTETSEWTALASVANRTIEGPTPPVAVAPVVPPQEAPVAEAPAPEADAPRRPESPIARPRPAAPVNEPAAEAPSTPESWLATARQALRDQRWSDAASAYGKLVAQFPSSAEAHIALVPLAKLELDRLGQPGSALTHLDAYLSTGGALELEARLTRIRALRALGKAADEARAIDDFLAAHPNSLEATKLRERREQLVPR